MYYNNSNNYNNNYYNNYNNNYSNYNGYDNYYQSNNKKTIKDYKIIFILIAAILLFSGFILFNFLNTSKKIVNINSMGVSLELDEDMVAVNTIETVFNYNGTKIPSNIVQFVDKKKENVLTVKSFPFTIKDYQSHFKSAFDSKNLIKIKKDYKETKVMNSNINQVYVSEAKINYNDKKTNSTIYTLNFNNKQGTLILEYVGDNNIKKIVNSLQPISLSSNLKIDEYVSDIKYFNNTEEKVLQENLSISIPSGYKEIRNNLSTHTQITYIGDKDIIDIQIHPVNSTNNKNINNLGYEKVKTTEDGKLIMHNLNNNTYCYMQSYNENINIKGIEYNVRLYYYDYVYGSEFFNEIKNSIKK